jgi:DNA-binding IclR family transcriptional regulator
MPLPDPAPTPLPRVDDPDGRSSIIQSIERAASVLALLDQDTRSLSPALVAERLGLNRSTAHRYLMSLQHAGFLGPNLGPGPLLDQLSALVSTRQQILGLAPEIMRQVADETGLTTTLSFLGPTGAVVTLVEETHRGTVVLTVRVGTVLELRAAQTRVLLAFQLDHSAASRAHASLTAAEAKAEQRVLTRVRRQRLAWADLGREGLASVAVPIFNGPDVPAAMGMLGTSVHLDPADPTSSRIQVLQAAARELSSLIGD